MSNDLSNRLRADNLPAPFYGIPTSDDTPSKPPLTSLSERRTYLQGRIVSLELGLLRTKALLNACAPINVLPTEMLATIILHLQNSCRPKDGYWHNFAWPSVLRVCRHWFVVAATTPDLWQDLFVTTSVEFLRTGLARSKSTQISVTIRYKSMQDEYKLYLHPHVHKEALDLLTPHVHRLRHLSLITNYYHQESVPRLLALMQHPMPALETFELTVRNWTSSDRDDTAVNVLTAERLPSLKSVSVGGVYLAPSSVFGQLTTLEWRGWNGTVPELTLDTLSTIVGACTRIQRLRLSYLQCGGQNASWRGRRMARCAMPELQYLHLETESATIKHILSILVPPADAQVVIQWAPGADTSPEELAQGLRAAIPEDRTGLPHLSHLIHAQIDVRHGQRRLAACPTIPHENALLGRGSLYLAKEERGTGVRVTEPPLSYDIIDVLRNSPLQHLHIDLESGEVRRVDWRAAFAPFRQLRHLSVHILMSGLTYGDMAGLFECLDPELAPEGTPDEERLLLPGLKSLEIGGSSPNGLIPTALIIALEKRKASLGWRVALEELTFSFRRDYHLSQRPCEERESACMERLESLVGRVTFVEGLSA